MSATCRKAGVHLKRYVCINRARILYPTAPASYLLLLIVSNRLNRNAPLCAATERVSLPASLRNQQLFWRENEESLRLVHRHDALCVNLTARTCTRQTVS